MKNPDEVAREVFNASWNKMGTKAIMAAAIRADREQIAAKLNEVAHPDNWGVPCVYVESFIRLALEEES